MFRSLKTFTNGKLNHYQSKYLQKCACFCVQVHQYQPTQERLEAIQKSPSGWVPPADPPPNLPFAIRRSRTNNVPVYTDYKSGRTRIITIVKKASGDLKALEDCLKIKLGEDKSYQINELTSSVKVKGDHKRELTRWLLELGF